MTPNLHFYFVKDRQTDRQTDNKSQCYHRMLSQFTSEVVQLTNCSEHNAKLRAKSVAMRSMRYHQTCPIIDVSCDFFTSLPASLLSALKFGGNCPTKVFFVHILLTCLAKATKLSSFKYHFHVQNNLKKNLN